jgi:uncharacterized protein YggT (Ycf19 family)
MTLFGAIGRDEIADYVNALFLVYLILIFARILLSWLESFGRVPYNVYLRAVIDFIHQTTDPYLNLFRRILPPIGMFDFSPIIAVILLFLARGIIVGIIEG